MVGRKNLSVMLLDGLQFGQPRAGAAYLLEAEKTALVDTGTAASAPHLLEALRGRHLDFVLVTHAHLDHAGGAGHIARAHPEATFFAHPRAVPHLMDPTRLVAAVSQASPELAPLYGLPVPIPRSRLVAAEGGEVLELGSETRLVVLATPGHASHHICAFEPSTATLFLGDAAGHHGVATDLPLTVPPRFDPAASRASIDRLLDLEPRVLAFAHFGFRERATDLLASYPLRVEQWLARVDELCRRVGVDGVADTLLREPERAQLSAIDQHVVRLCVRGALATLAERNASRQRLASSAPWTPAGPHREP